MIRSVFRPSRICDGKRERSRIYWGQYRFSPGEPLVRLSLKTTDKRIAEKRLDDIMREAEHEQAGILAPRSIRQAAEKPLTAHLEDVIADLASRGRSPEYIRKVNSRMQALVEACGWQRLQDVTADSFLSWRACGTLSPRTLNHYLDAANVVMGWLVSTNRILENPLVGIQKVETRGHATTERRAFTDAEVNRLLDVAGPRREIYLTAVQTGLRFSELRALQWRDVDMGGNDGALPAITLRAETTKSRRSDTIPLTRDVVAALATLQMATPDPTDRVFARGMPSHHTFARDLERAGIARTDGSGRKVDFHALRKTFITNLQRGGVNRRVAMALARHTDGRLTDGIYTDETALPVAEAVGRLPQFGDAETTSPPSPKPAQIHAQELVTRGPSLSLVGTANRAAPDTQPVALQ